MTSSDRIFALCGTGRMNHLAQGVLDSFNMLRIGEEPIKLSHINFGVFPDGESDDRIVEWKTINGKHVLFFACTHSDDLILEVLDYAHRIKKQCGAFSLTVVMPYVAHRRQDHPEKKEESHRLLAFFEQLKAAGVDRLIVCDPHSKQMKKNAKTVGLELHVVDPTPEFAVCLIPIIRQAKQDGDRCYFYAPDLGSIERNAALAARFNIPVAVNLKQRIDTNEIIVNTEPSPKDLRAIQNMAQKYGITITIANEELRGSIVFIREDELATARTLRKNADRLRNFFKVKNIFVCVTHPVCVAIRGWKRNVGVLGRTPFDKIFIGDTIYRGYENSTGGIMKSVGMANLIGHTLNKIMKKI